MMILHSNQTEHPAGVKNLHQVDFDNLYAALVECFGIILLGFLAGLFKFITDTEAKGLATFVGNFALPALIFGSLANLDMSSVQWTFVLGIFLSKFLLFLSVLLVSLLVLKPMDVAKSGLFAIFATQSNDFALGYPILKAVYGNTHPEAPMYLYLLAPISLVILNPIGFLCMEVGRDQRSGSRIGKFCIQLKNVLKNPVVFMTLAGVLANFVFKEHLPSIINQFLTTLGSAFSASALFLLGITMVGKRSLKILQGSGLVITMILIAVKLIVLPIVSREIMTSLHAGKSENETEFFSNFAFLYGTFPTAPSVFVFASQYNILPELMAGTMVACTFVAAPLMFISARLVSIPSIDPNDYIHDLDTFLLDISIIGLIATVWAAFVLIATSKYLRPPHFMTLALIVSQAVGCVGAIMWSVIDCTHGWKLYLQFIFYAYGVYATRINTALLAVTLFLVQIKSSHEVNSWRPYFLGAGFGIPLILVLTIIFAVTRETLPHGHKTDPNFQYGETQAGVALLVLVLAFCVTITFLIMTQRKRSGETHNSSSDGSSRRLLDSTTDTDEDPQQISSNYNTMRNVRQGQQTSSRDGAALVEIEDFFNEIETVVDDEGDDVQGSLDQLRENQRNKARQRIRYRCDTEHREYCAGLLSSYSAPPVEEALNCNNEAVDIFDTFKHSVLLLILSLSMFVGIGLCIWTLVMEKISGLYLELIFLDGFLNFGQGLFPLVIFGLDNDYITVPIQRWIRRLFYGRESLVLPPWEDLKQETKQHCRQFLKHHISRCMETILQDITCQGVPYRAVFRGTEFVDWLTEFGLARDRLDAVHYARHLVRGRVIRHVDNNLDFYDDAFLYTFEPVDQRP